MKKRIIFFLIMATSLNLSAQDDKAQIEQTLTTFVDGWAVGDSTQAGKSLHPTWHIKFFRENKLTDMTRMEYLSGFKPKERYKDLKFNVLSIDITGNIAMAKTEIINEKFIFIDYLSLIKTNEGWVMVEKITFKKDKI
jgi:hypothetical protein